MDFTKFSYDELINYCKENNINYISANKKPYKAKSLIKNIMKKKSENEIIEDTVNEEKEVELINKVVWTSEKTQETNENYKQIKDNLQRVIKKCHDILYSSHSVVGIKAQNDIMKILTLIILKPQFENKESELNKKCQELLEKEEISQERYDKYMSYCLDLNKLRQNDNPLNEWKMFIGEFIIKIFNKSIYNEEDNRFNFNDEKVFMKLIEIILELNIDNDFIDAFSTSYGDIHEAFRVYSGGKGAKELGQFFTPRHLIHSIFHGCGLNDIIKSYKNPTIYDCCMGTGGLLTRAFSNGNILPNNIYGCETERDTIKFGECSILLTTNQFNSNIIKCDSLCNNPYILKNKFDIIFTNPPFGTKMKYEDLESKFNDFKEDNIVKFKDIYPIKTNNGACLFIQHCMYMLNKNGTCAIVLPDGELFTNKNYIKFRKFMCDNVNIIKIINVEGGAFEHTSIKVSVIIFQKNGSTNNIEFMEIPKKCNEVKSCAIVNINNIKNNNYDFNLNKYMKKEENTNIKFEYKKLGDVFDITKGSLQSSKNIEGDYVFITASEQYKCHNKYTDDCECLLFVGGAEGSLAKVHYYNGKFIYSDLLYKLIFKNNKYNYKYFYHYLNYKRKEYINNPLISCGTPKKSISIDRLKEIKIPIPSLEIQEKIVKDIETITKSIEIIKLRITQLKDEAKLFMKFYKQRELDELNKNAEIKKLGDICEINYGTRIVKKDITIGEYPCYGGGDISFYINEYNRENFNILISRFALSDKCVRLLNCKFYLNDSGLTVKSTNEKILDKYIGYYLYNNQNKIYNISRGTAQKNLDIDEFKSIKIPIPSLDIQEKIIEIYKNLEEDYITIFLNKIEDENKHIELLNKLSKNIFNQ
jgi:type I restriction-modification system DNA methylase subunit/restriction endonuclease S subunit